MDENLFPKKPRASMKELAVSTLVCVVLWIASFTVLSPLFFFIFLSPSFQKKFFAFVFTKFLFGRGWTDQKQMRKAIFDRMRENIGTRPLKILELGVGTGANLEYYKPEDSVTLLDMNVNFRSSLEGTLKKFPDVNVERFVTGRAEDMMDIQSDYYDIVVCTHLLCSVPDVKSVMTEAKRVLKSGGKFAFMEHIGYPKTHFGYWIQKAFTPIWSIYCCGCRLDRNLPDTLKSLYSDVSYEVRYPVFMPTILRPHAVAVGKK